MLSKRQQWYADQVKKLGAAERLLAAETNPKKLRSCRARVANHKRRLTMGPERTSEASAKANRTMRNPI